ncbi:MAG: 2,3-bisphosphoglycerate-independent phosphoglycerate mutase [Phycisphaerales bacterium]|nr:2,3-bisphosphoglycerate-independent phosphoglycerate mutase [Phycisphaerales bacterium]
MTARPTHLRPTVLIVRDGWGENPHPEHDAFNAVKLARTPVADQLSSIYPTTLIHTSGEDVGLPVTADGPVMGNSEVGHQNIGAGRIVDQELMRITRTIRDGSFFRNAALKGAFEHVRRTGGRVHLFGLLSDGLVHSALDHVLTLVDLAAREGLGGDRLLIQAFGDGRDTPPASMTGFVDRVEAHLRERGIGRIASVAGRFYAMDRDHRWDRVEKAYRCLTEPIEHRATTATEAIERYHRDPADPDRRSDEFIEPTQIGEPAFVRDGDAVVFFNFRGDRPRELVKAFVLDDDAWAMLPSQPFVRRTRPQNLWFCTLTAYEEDLPVHVAFPKPPKMKDILGAVIAESGLTQFRCAETEKFPHVTFFFNDYRDDPFVGERRELIPSPRDVATYDLKPEMSAVAVCEAVLRRLAAEDCEPLIVVNFANGDMVGHTGVLPAAIRAVETVDACVGRIVDATLARGGAAIVTADHGNAEQMWDPVHDCPHTAHTNYDVPCIVVAEAVKGRTLRKDGRLADLAPTVLHLMGIAVPDSMTGRSLLEVDTL